MESMLNAIVQATFVSKCVLAFLLFMSVMSWAYMGGKWIALLFAQKRTDRGLVAFDSAQSLPAALNGLEKNASSPLFGITRRAVREFNRINITGDAEKLLNDNVRRALHFGIAEEMARLKSSLALLATTANTAPFIGLFGTVWGIMHSFQAIAQMKSVSLATVAPGIAEALIATAVGLFVAIPATCGYNIFRAKLTAIEGVCINYAGQLLNRMQHEVARHETGLSFAGERQP
ncbi:MotA/TolQ/ExbB proton channel family protein [Desulfobulbus sp.]|jgi:biopolymer transport protein TolQ|uniref:MotA/TolQ/ExbB proton channel family protein n=1 Tax=Desulfobulbus sp. TaxID=895 RepID=UPI002852C0E8|nr:MotA/TolQ/ExbB proton channel family protein [Desulfobulbus sp.]